MSSLQHNYNLDIVEVTRSFLTLGNFYKIFAEI